VLAYDPGLGLDQGADLLGALLVTGGLMLGVYTIVEVPERGWGAAPTLVGDAAALAALAAFVWRQATTPKPLLPLRIFGSRLVSAANVVQALLVAGLFGFFFLGSLYLERVLDYNPTQIGLAFLPVALAIGALSLGLSARLMLRFEARGVLAAGLALVFGGLVLLSRVPLAGDYLRDLLPAMLLLGLGGGLAFPSLTSLAMSATSDEDAGLASGLFNTTAQVGGALGLAVLATLSVSRTERLLADGASLGWALTGGYQLAFGIGAGLVALALLLSMLLLGSPACRAPEASEVRAPAVCAETP
jgi:hypothetical protein